MVSFSSVAFIALAYATCLVNAIPLVSRDPLDVAAPPITYPTKGVVWTVGQTETVTWDTSNLPAQITNPTAMIVLGWMDSSGGLNLQLKTPLATGIPITSGSANIVVPSGYPDGDQYILALIGSSGDVSPTFTITSGGGSPSSNTPSPTTTTTTPPAQSSPSPDSQPTPTTTTSSTPPTNNDAASPSSSSSHPPSGPSSSKSSSSSSPSSSPSGTSDNSNSNSSSNSSSNAGSVTKPVGTLFVSFLAASLATLFL